MSASNPCIANLDGTVSIDVNSDQQKTVLTDSDDWARVFMRKQLIRAVDESFESPDCPGPTSDAP